MRGKADLIHQGISIGRKCDLLVVGGGPAGSSAARAAAERNEDVILVEKEQDFDERACAEGIGQYLLPLLPFEIPKDYLEWNIEGIKFSHGDFELERKGYFYRGWSLDRARFDEWLLQEAQKAGAEVIRPCKLEDIAANPEKKITQVKCNKDGEEVVIEPSKVIAADGSESTIGDALDVYDDREFGYAYSWEMSNLDLDQPNLEQVYIGDYAPGAYAYVFPKSDSTANVGVGTRDPEVDLEEKFDEFVNEIIPDRTKNAVREVKRVGKAPFNYGMDSWAVGNILFAGDAANQNFKPYIEGILPAIICGDIAGKTAANGDLENYRKRVERKLDGSFSESEKVMENIEIIDKKNGKMRNLLQLTLFAYPYVEDLKDLEDMNEEEILQNLKERNSLLRQVLEGFVGFYWNLKTSIFNRDTLR